MNNHVYEIHTDRLIIRCYKPSDALSLKTAIDQSLDHLLPWMPWAKNEPEELSQKVERLRKYRGQFDLDLSYTYWIFEKDNKTLVWSSWYHNSSETWSLEIWYWIRLSHIGKWFATEVTKALTKTWFEMLSLECIHIHCDSKNERSANIPQKLWFTKEATLKVNEKDDNWNRKEKLIWKMFSETYQKCPFEISLRFYDECWDEIFSS